MKTKTNTSLLLILVGFFLFYSLSAVHYHNTFYTSAFDLGIMDQVIWQYSHFNLPFSSVKHLSILGDHFSPILIFFAPLYWIWSDPRILLIVQALLVVLSSVPLYFISMDVINFSKPVRSFLSLLVVCIYLLFIGLQNGLSFDFHPATIVVFPLSLLLYSMHFRKWRLFFVFLLIGLLFKEDVATITFALGIYMMIWRREARIGLVTMIISLLYFSAVVFWLMPSIDGGSVAGGYLNFDNFGNSPVEISKNILFNPKLAVGEFIYPKMKRETLIVLLSSFGFLPLMSALSWIISAPIFIARFFSVSQVRWGLNFHYSSSAAPIFAVGFLYSVRRVSSFFTHYTGQMVLSGLVVYALASTLIVSATHTTLLSRFIRGEFPKADNTTLQIREVLSEVPPSSSVSAQSSLVPHLSQRNQIYLYPDQAESAEYIVLSTSRTTYPLNWDEMIERLDNLKKSQNHELILQVGGSYLFRSLGGINE